MNRKLGNGLMHFEDIRCCSIILGDFLYRSHGFDRFRS